MRAVLFNTTNLRLGEVDVPDDTMVIEFGGGVFALSPNPCVLDRGRVGMAFDQTVIQVVRDLTLFEPRRRAEASS